MVAAGPATERGEELQSIDEGRRLRRRFPAGTLVPVALTGYGQAEDMAGTRAAGFDRHTWLEPIRLGTVRELSLTLGADVRGDREPLDDRT